MTINEKQLRNIIRETVEQVLINESTDEGLGDWFRSVKNGIQAGRNVYKSSNMMDNAPSKYNPWNGKEIEDYFTQLNQQEHELQVQLNQLRNKKRALMKKYNISRGSGKGNERVVYSNPTQVRTNNDVRKYTNDVKNKLNNSNNTFARKAGYGE